ncbi:MAG: hypothetical protein H7Z14_12735 [Anaerolineae bacterium]|nr:hypothetical protein [Phycisphaerae bacterium]
MSTSVPMAANELARRSDGAIEVRIDPMRVRIDLSAMQSKDHHDLRCTFDCSVRVAENASDRRLLGEVLLADRNTLTRENVAAHLAHQVRARVESFLHDRPAVDVLSGPARDELLSAIRSVADAAAFACGLIVLPPYQLDLQSNSVQREKIEQMQRVRAEERSADQVEHLRRAGDLLKQFQSVRESSNNISPGQILQQISPADRGTTLEALLAASSRQDGYTTLWAVAGQSLARIVPGETTPTVDLLPIPDKLGPLRSVQPARWSGAGENDVLLIGARDGCWAVDRESPAANPQAFADPELKSQLGFNRVADWKSPPGILATHADGGVVAWEVRDNVSPHTKLREYGRAGSAGRGVGARNLQVFDAEHAIFSVGNELVLMTGDARTPLPIESSATIVSIVLAPNEFLAIHEDGLIVRYDRAAREPIARETRGGRINAVCALPWIGSIRLLLAREDAALECVGVDDQLVTQYLSTHRGYKILAASVAVVAAVSSDRQRLILWHTWDGRKPFAELHLTSQTRHRIADIDFG